MSKDRQSNIELLRIVVMFMILLLHANIFTFGWPEGSAHTKLIRFLLESISIVSVNVFVLITGYFGTSFKLSKIINLVYQMIFTVVIVTFFLIACNVFKPDSWKELIHGFYFWNYWFINSYIVLLVLSPLPNLAIKYLSRHSIKVLLFVLFLVFCVIEGDFFISPPGVGISSGYSAMWFVFIYLLGRYLAIYPSGLNLRILVLIYLVSLLGSVFMMWRFSDYGYNSPFIVLASVAFFLLFTRINLRDNKTINFIASSSLMVFLLHCHPLIIIHFKNILLTLNNHYGNGGRFVFALLAFCIVVYVVAILFDQFRKYFWRFIEPYAKNLDRRVGFFP